MPRWTASGETPQEQTWDRWMEGEIGDRLWELADFSTPDIVTDDDGNKIADWPPFDIEVEIIEKLEAIKLDIGRYARLDKERGEKA